eukprot:110070_1
MYLHVGDVAILALTLVVYVDGDTLFHCTMEYLNCDNWAGSYTIGGDISPLYECPGCGCLSCVPCYCWETQGSLTWSSTSSTQGYDQMSLTYSISSEGLVNRKSCAIEYSKDGGSTWNDIYRKVGVDIENFDVEDWRFTGFGTIYLNNFVLRLGADGGGIHCFFRDFLLTAVPLPGTSAPSAPTEEPTRVPSQAPSVRRQTPSANPTITPITAPSQAVEPSLNRMPSANPTITPITAPSQAVEPSLNPSVAPINAGNPRDGEVGEAYASSIAPMNTLSISTPYKADNIVVTAAVAATAAVAVILCLCLLRKHCIKRQTRITQQTEREIVANINQENANNVGKEDSVENKGESRQSTDSLYVNKHANEEQLQTAKTTTENDNNRNKEVELEGMVNNDEGMVNNDEGEGQHVTLQTSKGGTIGDIKSDTNNVFNVGLVMKGSAKMTRGQKAENVVRVVQSDEVTDGGHDV